MRVLILLAIGSAIFAQERYAVVLEAPPTAVSHTGRAKVLDSQKAMRGHLSRMKVREMGSTESLVNAVFVEATAEEAIELAGRPGVK